LSSRVLRYDTREALDQRSAYLAVDLCEMFGMEPRVGPDDDRPAPECFDGACFDGRYVYLAPLMTRVAVRYDTHGEFSDPASWSMFDASPLGMDMNVGVLFDGRWVYYVAYGHGVIVRFD